MAKKRHKKRSQSVFRDFAEQSSRRNTQLFRALDLQAARRIQGRGTEPSLHEVERLSEWQAGTLAEIWQDVASPAGNGLLANERLGDALVLGQDHESRDGVLKLPGIARPGRGHERSPRARAASGARTGRNSPAAMAP